MKNTIRILRQVRRNNIAILWNSAHSNIEFVNVPKRARKKFFRSTKNQDAMHYAIEFFKNPTINPVSKRPL